MQKAQAALNYDLTNIVGALCSHEHADHSKAIRDVMKAGIDVYASEGTLSFLGWNLHRRAKTVEVSSPFRISEFEVMPFLINHDAAEPLGFVIRCDDEYLLFATDTSHIKQRFNIKFNIIAIECSYNKEYLAKRVKEKTINEELAKRLLSSHMEEKEAMRYLAEFCDLSKCSEIHLLHMSADNINKDRIKTEFEKRFCIKTRIVEQ